MKKILPIILLCFSYCFLSAQVTLTTDFTSSSNNKGNLYDIWTVANRISPTSGVNVKPGLGVNTIRIIGGILKTVNGVKVPDLDFDPVSYNTTTNSYVYNWTNLKSRINAIKNQGTPIYQIVLDQVPWCFQRSYTFIPTGTRDNVHFRENEKISIYGNSLPPDNKVAYFNFIKAMITELVATYGQAEVQSWRFRVGSEIETPDHWFGTEQDFVDHYANTVKAVLQVLPNAKVGLHTREPLYQSKTGGVPNLNYKGEAIKSFKDGIINYCDSHSDVRYDFWGLSDYLLINSVSDRDFTTKYNIMFQPLISNPKWNANAKCDVMEYSIVTTMDAPDGKGYVTVATPHADIANLAYTNTFYKNAGLGSIFRWGMQSTSADPVSVDMLKSMNGKTRFLTSKTGTPAISTNQLDAIVTNNAVDSTIGAVVYNYNSSSLNYQANENVNLSFIVDLPVGSVVKYRSLTYGKTQNDLENFLLNEPSSGWIKSGFDRRGDPSRTLNTAGAAAWANYTNPTPATFGSWTNITTVARSGSGSQINIATTLGSFSLKKYEIEVVSVPAPVQSPYTTSVNIPDGTIEAENYDKGGEGVAYHDSNAGNTGNVYRMDDVDIGIVPTSQGGGYSVGWTNTGEWMEYKVHVLASGNYNMNITYSSGLAGAKIGASFPDEGITLFSNLDLAQTTGGYNEYANRTKFGVYLTAGYHILRISIDQKGFNLDKIVFSEPVGGISSAPNSRSAINSLELQPDKTNAVSVYPNPSNTGIFTLAKAGVWQVYNLSGSKVLEGKGDKIDLSVFAKGMYTLQTETSTHKLIYQ